MVGLDREEKEGVSAVIPWFDVWMTREETGAVDFGGAGSWHLPESSGRNEEY